MSELSTRCVSCVSTRTDVLALNKAHVLRLNAKICQVFTDNTKEGQRGGGLGNSHGTSHGGRPMGIPMGRPQDGPWEGSVGDKMCFSQDDAFHVAYAIRNT